MTHPVPLDDQTSFGKNDRDHAQFAIMPVKSRRNCEPTHGADRPEKNFPA